MAQGKLKVKTNAKKPNQKKRPTKQGKVVKKGRKVIAPRKPSEKEALQVKKSIQKAINKNIEQELASRAHQIEEGKKFNFINVDQGKKKKK